MALSKNESIAVAIGLVVVAGVLGVAWMQSASAPSTATATTGQDTSTQTTADTTGAAPTNSTSTTMTDTDTLVVQDTLVGTGATVKSGDTVSVLYTGALTNGTVFDSTSAHGGQPIQFQIGVGQVIKGWDQGLVGMKVGGKRHLVIPAALGYEAQPMGPIPANSTLVFDIELKGIK